MKVTSVSQSETLPTAAILEAELQNGRSACSNLTVGKGTRTRAQNFHVLTDWRYGYVGFKLPNLSHLIITTTNFSSRLRTILSSLPSSLPQKYGRN